MLMPAPRTAKSAAARRSRSEPRRPALYVALDPPFVVNFEAEQLVRFLQVTVQVMSRDQATVDHHQGRTTRSCATTCCCSFGNQSYSTISSREGKEKLRQQALEAVRKVVTNAGGKASKGRSHLLHQLRDAVSGSATHRTGNASDLTSYRHLDDEADE